MNMLVKTATENNTEIIIIIIKGIYIAQVRKGHKCAIGPQMRYNVLMRDVLRKGITQF